MLPVPTKADIQAVLNSLGTNLEVEQNPPPFKLTVITNTQAGLDKTYLDSVAKYNQALAEWISDAQESQASGKPLPSFQPSIPIRQVMFPIQGFNPGFFQVPVTDPSIKPPSIPPFTTTPNIPAPVGTSSGTQTDMMNSMLYQIITDLGKIKKALGIN